MPAITFIPGNHSRTCATAPYASKSGKSIYSPYINQFGQTVYNGNINCTNSEITNKQFNSNSDVIVTKTQVERARNAILYAKSGRIQFGNFGSLAEVQAFLQNNTTIPGIYKPYVYLDQNGPFYQYYNNYSTQPNRIPGIRNRF